MHPAPSDGHREGELEMSISILCHVLNKTGYDTDFTVNVSIHSTAAVSSPLNVPGWTVETKF
ncbi:hypothetical protein EYF80_024562 [Liparis tanakae]|uniref:Uncharacterized protein n=1 Tax=Liparis tanakae TaxID=230148 RepID=A0A4Z2HK22_9TELE|nr:hypothetical protein EYF80_024562 [Liparis tanakae]